jgi:hypothetical protein
MGIRSINHVELQQGGIKDTNVDGINGNVDGNVGIRSRDSSNPFYIYQYIVRKRKVYMHLCTYVPMYLCTYELMNLYAAMQLCSYVPM